ncbi:MAG: methyltransferase domain-containing protein [Chloroflexus sp.]
MSYRIEIIVPAGLDELARAEAQRISGLRLDPPQESGVISATMHGSLAALLHLRCATSVFLARNFAIPRPRALLGDEHFRAVLALIETVRRLHPAGTFQTLLLSAAGADSSVLRRFKHELSVRLGLTIGEEDGDLVLRLRPGRHHSGWDLLVRLTPRPLATRAWRVCNREGALSGPVAHAMALLSKPRASDRVLNIGCGSGTLLIERLLIKPAAQAIGCDINPEALVCAYRNLAAARLSHAVELYDWDARQLPLPSASVNVVLADLPFGHLVGSHATNLTLYPALLREAARVTWPGGCAVLISHEVRLMERVLADLPAWRSEQSLRVDLGGLYPRIFVLRRVDLAE